MIVRIYGKESIDDLDWSSIKNGNELRAFYEPIIKNSSSVFVSNSNHQVEVLQVENQLYPLTIGRKCKKDTCYLFSFIVQYIDYTKEEVLNGSKYSSTQKIIAKFLFPGLRILGNLLGMEKVVFVNNYFLATNLYEKDTLLMDSLTIQYLKEYYPKRVIAFRSINEATDTKIIHELQLQGGLPLVCRQLYILDPSNSNFQKKRPVIQDMKLWENTENIYWEKVLEFKSEEIDLILNYYKDLYLKKYSKLNPDYTPAWLTATIKSNILDYYILRELETNLPLAVQAVERTRDIVCTPFIGYDQNKPKKAGLYRLMNLQLTLLAIKEKKILNMSSGASTFKKQRGGIPFFEYHIVFINHLPKRKQWFWMYWHALMESKIKPTMKRLGI